jgi:hypothetical protein
MRKKTTIRRAGRNVNAKQKRPRVKMIATFGDLENYLENLDGRLFSDMAALERVRARKKRANGSCRLQAI